MTDQQIKESVHLVVIVETNLFKTGREDENLHVLIRARQTRVLGGIQ
jgi:hypothetical protein